MRQRRKIVALALSLLATVAVLFGSTSLAYAADGEYPIPDAKKELINNEDGTYTLKLSVTGSAKSETESPKVNVVLVMDRSGSMQENTYAEAQYGRYGLVNGEYVQLYYYNGYRLREVGNNDNHDTVYTEDGSQYTGTRYAQSNRRRDQVAIEAATKLADNLLGYNDPANPDTADTVEMAFVSFNDMAANGNNGRWTTDKATADSVISNYTYEDNTGTNWEDALIHAKALADAKHDAQPDEQMFIIFLTDGNPTRYVNNQGGQAGSGYEYTDNINTCYNEAAPRALDLTNAGYELYNIGVFGNVDRMQNLTTYANGATADGHGTATYYAAANASALESAFAEILRAITNSLSLADVKFTDGVTDMTHSTGVNGTPGNFTYTITHDDTTETWDAAPAATVNANKEVIWDLSKDKDGNDLIIQDGVTVTCSFLVWPDQDAMDLIADLNNNKVSYDSLTPAQKEQITGSEGNYSLKTNTECKLDYSVLENKDGNITKIPQDTIWLNPPEPMPLFIDKLSLEKKWEDSLDPDQKEEVEGEVKLDFYKDNEKYVLPGYEGGITLTEAENWVKENFLSIATGIMVSEKSPAYDERNYPVVTYDGTTYCILETGHDYHFQEQDINNHFELTAYTYHPMLVDGVLHNLTFEKDSAGNITGVTDGAEISTVSATNTIKGGVSITKKVVDEDGNEVDSSDPFTIVMHIQNPEEYDYRIYYGEKNPHYNDPEEGTENPSAEEMATNLQRHRSGHFIGTGSEVSVTIYQGDELRFVNVADGTEYYVDENETTGYTKQGITYQIHYGDDAAGVTHDYTDDQKKVDGDTTWYVMQGNSNGVVEVTNTYKSGELDITKTVACDDAEKAEAAKKQEFEFTVKLYADATKATELTSSEYAYTVWENGAATSTTGTVKSGGIIKLKDGQTAKIEKLPEGAYYEVTEAAVQGYTTTKTGDTGNIVKNEAKTATFTNTYNYEDVYKPLTLTLNKVDANTGNKIDGAVFTLTKTDGTTQAQDYTVTNGTVTIDFDKPGTYTLVEKTAPDGYEKVEGTWTIEVQKDTDKPPVVTYKEDKNVFEWLYELIFGSVEKDPADGWTYDNGTLTVSNPPTTTEVEAKKTWNDNDDQDGVRPKSVTFQLYKTVNGQTTAVKDADGNNVTAELSGKGDNTWTTTFKDLPAYEDGYKVTYSVMEMNASGAVVAEGGKLDDNYTASYGSDGLTVTNKHEIDKTKVTVTKNWNDNKNADKTRPESVSVTLSADGTAVGNAVTLNEGNKWTYTWENLDVNAAGKAITYTVDEAPVDGYAKSISDISGSATAGYSYTITNSNVTVDTNTTAFFKKSVTTPNDVQDAVFEFKIEAVDGAPMPKDSTGAVVTTGTATYEKGTSGDKAIDFGKITYTAAGEYKYKITETNKPAGWTATPDKPVEVTVTVTGDAATGFNATVGGKTITNSYSANSVKTTLTATKKVYGKDAEGAFGFSLKLTKGDESGVTIPEGSATAATSDSIKKGGSEQVSFADIEFTKPGTYVFTVDETTEAPSDKWVYDASTHDITVKVTDDGAGALSAKVTGDNPAFYNTYEDDVKTVSAGTSTTNIDGQDVQAGQTLTYTINWTAAAGGETADVVVTDTIPANTTLKADSVSAGGTVSEDGKTITWAFPRQEPGATGTVSFQVTVDEAAAGTKLDNAATVLSGKNDANTNTVTNEVKKGGFKLSKVIVSTTGVTDDEAEFTFEVSAKDSAGNPLKGSYAVKVGDETAEKAFEDGKIEITLTNGQVAVIDGLPVGTTYTVTETDVPKGYELTAVNGEDAPAEGTISGVVDVDVLSFEFENTYSASGKAEIPVSKTVTSATEGTEPGKWSFDFAIAAGAYEGEAKDVAVPLPEETTVTLSGSGNETVSGAFGEIEYAAAGTYTYTVTESGTEGSANAGISPVEATKTVTVTVEDNGDGSLTATVKDAGTAAAFENVYNVEKTGIVLGASKKLEVEKPANNAPDVSGKYTFTLKEDDEVIDTKTNPDGDGTAVSFEKISYDKPGEHQYTVTESGKVEGVTNGQDSYTVKVNVSDQGDGTLKAEVTEGSQVTAFTNTYSVEPVTLDTTKQFNVTKSLDGTPLTAGAFKFTLTAGSNDADVETPMPKNASVTNDASGKVTFGEITYNKPGTYNYTISEVDGGVGGYTYDKNTVAVKVVVTDNGAGALVAEVSYDGSTTFVNTYEAKGEFAPTAQKLVEGHSLADEQFTFQLLDKDGKVIEETKNNDAGQVIFKAIQYTQDDFDDMATTEEDATDEAATTTDEAADTTDEAAATTDEAAATTDEAADTTDEAADTTDEATTDEAAADEATTDEAKPQKRTKTFEYTVREINDGQGGWTYDDHEAKYIVTVTDNGEGEMEISYEKDGEPTFVNTYKATGKTGEGALAGTKTVPGTKLKDGQFSFQLKDSDGNVIETVSNDANGNFEFSALSYVKNSKKDETGEHTYSIVEVNDGQRGYTYDSHVCDVTVTVTDNDEGKLNVTVKLSDGKKAAFSNPYKPLATSAPVTAKKVLEGRDLKAGEFTFELRDAEGKVVATATNAASGLVDFGYVSFDEVGTYTFTATEVKGSDANVTYDSSTKTYTVEVVDDGGQLVATVTCDDPSATFTNVYKKPDVPGKPGKPKKKVVIPQTGDDTPTGAMAALTVFGAAALTAGTVLQRRKRK